MIGSVAKALEILSLFSTDEPRLMLTTISKRMGIPKSTAHHLVSTLLQYGFVEQQDDASYALGKTIIALTQNVLVNVELRDRAAPLLRELADVCSESVYLTVRDGDQVLYIYAIESPQRLLARTAVGDRAPLYCTSVGKAILAFLPSRDIVRMYGEGGAPLAAFTPHTLTNLNYLLDELALSRTRGYAIDNQEHELDTYCVGAPIFNASNAVIGACSISGTDPHIVGARLEALADGVVQVTQDISRRMGYVPGRMSMVRQNHMRGGV
jgi:DNA-binding IclR family transcriptional regulator